MPVSAALLVGAGNPPASAMNGQFVRGDKATSSVKLRRRNKDVEPSNQSAVTRTKKNHRHSCDFSVLNDRSQSVNYLHNDFDYITFPNGVPVVQGVHVMSGGGEQLDAGDEMDMLTSLQPPGALHPSVGGVTGGASRRQRSTTSVVHITRRESPQQQHHQHFRYSRPVSSSAINIHRGGGAMDPSRQAPASHLVMNRRSSPGHSPSKQVQPRPARMSNNLPVQMRQSPSSHFLVSSTKDSVSPIRHLGRPVEVLAAGVGVGQQVPARGAARHKSSKPASNEFEFKMSSDSEDLDKQAFLQLMKHGILKSGDSKAGSQESGIFSTGSSQESPTKSGAARQPGLGRRAITQLNLRENRNSKQGMFSGELARSQENVHVLTQDSHGSHAESSEGHGGDDTESSLDQSATLRKGLLWQQRDKLFSSWKERYFILTQHFLQCFKKETSRITDMGGFLFKIKLSDIESVELLDKKGYLTICLNLAREPKMFLRKTEGIRDWYNLISSCVKESRTRKVTRVGNGAVVEERQATDSSGIESYVFQKRRLNFRRSDSTPEIHKHEPKERITLDELSNLYKNEEEAEKRKQEVILKRRMNRLSLMTDMELLPDLSRVQMNRDPESRHRSEADSGHNSLNTNRSGGSTISSKHSVGPMESHFPEMEEEGEDITLVQTPVSTPGDCGPKSLCDNVGVHRVSVIEGPRSLAAVVGGGVSSIKEEEDVTISCSMPSPKIRICNPQENKNVIEVRYRERSSPRSGGGVTTAAVNKHIPSAAGKQPSPRDSKATHVNRLQITHV